MVGSGHADRPARRGARMDHKSLKVQTGRLLIQNMVSYWKREPAIVTIVHPLGSECTNAGYPNMCIALQTNRRYVWYAIL